MSPVEVGTRMVLTCYTDTHGWGWHHVDLFLLDDDGQELNWVHWTVPGDGPDVADEVTARVEPLLHRTSDWRRSVGPSGVEYWEADAEWREP